MPIIAGRAIDDRDSATGPPVTVVNQALAKFFPRSAIGARLRVNGRSVEVVGIVRTMFSARLGVRVMGAIAACGLLLAMAGLYAVVSQMVAQRKREIGIRMALGARPKNIVMLVAGHGAKLAVAGIGAGSITAWWASRFLDAPKDPWIFALSALLIFAANMAACMFPTKRACRVDPSVALRDQ